MLVGVFPLTSYRLALRLHNEVPGIVVPERAAGRARATPARARPRSGMAHARELLEAARDRCEGVYVVAPFRRPLGVLDLLS